MGAAYRIAEMASGASSCHFWHSEGRFLVSFPEAFDFVGLTFLGHWQISQTVRQELVNSGAETG
jgi:hypothetical protein